MVESKTNKKAANLLTDMPEVYRAFPDKEALIRIINHLFGDIVVVDQYGKVVFFSEEVAELLQMPPAELLDINIYDFEKLGLCDRYPACAEVLDQKSMVMKFVKTGNKARVVVSNPIFGADGQLEMAVMYSQCEDLLDQFAHSMKKQRDIAEKTIKYLQDKMESSAAVMSHSPKMQDIYLTALKAAATDCTITLYGESGTGKEVMAHYIHRNSTRSSTKFIPVNCAAIPPELLESELFGYEPGAFTGARSTGKPGLFEIANEGTIFLDEIGELPLSMQSKLLRVLETGDIMRIGSYKQRHTNVRIITATNRNLLEMTREGSFRADLYYRLHILPFTILPLRQRPEDILPIAEYFLQNHNQKEHDNKYFSEQTLQLFAEYSWPGNVRELKNVIERMVIVSPTSELNIARETLFGEAPGPQAAGEAQPASVLGFGSNYRQAVGAFEKRYIEEMVALCHGNIAMAARKLGLHRSSIYKKLEEAD